MGSRSKTDNRSDQSLLDILTDWYHLPVLLLIVGAMFAIRMQTYSNFIRDGEVFFSGNDAWYHFREVMYITDHWPSNSIRCVDRISIWAVGRSVWNAL